MNRSIFSVTTVGAGLTGSILLSVIVYHYTFAQSSVFEKDGLSILLFTLFAIPLGWLAGSCASAIFLCNTQNASEDVKKSLAKIILIGFFSSPFISLPLLLIFGGLFAR